jgi:hypothetical protein
MQPAIKPAVPGPAAALMPAVPASAAMDREFVVRNQIVERYLSGRLPLKGAQDFERFCREHPELLDELGLADRVNAGVRLLDAGGRATPWEEAPKKFWERPPVLIAVAAAAVALAITSLILDAKLSARERTLALLQQRLTSQPLEPAQSTRAITLIPSRTAPSLRSAVTIGGGSAQLADLKFDLSWSAYTSFTVTIDRIDQGRVAVLHNVQRDSNGNVRLALNSSALGPGDYQFTLEGLTWRGEPVPQAWITLSIVH